MHSAEPREIIIPIKQTKLHQYLQIIIEWQERL